MLWEMMQVCASTKREREMQNESNEISFPDFEELDRGDIPAALEFCISIILLGKTWSEMSRCSAILLQ